MFSIHVPSYLKANPFDISRNFMIRTKKNAHYVRKKFALNYKEKILNEDIFENMVRQERVKNIYMYLQTFGCVFLFLNIDLSTL